MLLTSFERMRRYLASEANGSLEIDESNLIDNQPNKRDVLPWIQSASSQVEKYLGRKIGIESRTEYFDLIPGQKEFWVAAPPISTLTSVYEDSSGQWDGDSESELDDPIIGSNSYSFITDTDESLGYKSKKAIRVIYTGGLAYHATQSVYTLTTDDDTGWTAGYFIEGDSSGSVGIVKSFDSINNRLTVEVLYGLFDSDEAITEYTTERLTTASGETGTISAKYRTALCEAYPDIVRACEIQVSHYYRFKSSFELSGVNQDGSSLRRPSTERVNLQPETRMLLDIHRLIVFP